MAFDTAVYTGPSVVNGQQCVNVKITDSSDSTKSIVKQYFPYPGANSAWLDAQVLNDVNALNSSSSFIDNLTIGSTISLAKPVTPIPTAQSVFLNNYNLLLQLNAAKSAGITGVDTTI